MEFEFKMPQLGLNMTSGVIVSWLIKEGQSVTLGQPIMEIETDKATQEVASPVSGVLNSILQKAGETVPCHQMIARFTIPGDGSSVEQASVASTQEAISTEKPADSPVTSQFGRILISPIAKSLAKDLKIDLNAVTPRNGKIGREEVVAAFKASQNQSTPLVHGTPTGSEKMSVLRKRIAENMSKSHQTAARVGLTIEVDASQLLVKKNQLESAGTKLSLNVLIAKVVSIALTEHPALMSQLKEDEILHPIGCNIGIAVDAPAGLVVPVLKDVSHQSLQALQQQMDGMVNRSLAGKNTAEDLEGGVFTITNLGGFEIDSFYPMIRLPECAILAVGAIVRKPVVIAEAIAIRSRMNITLAFDHRLVDGAPAAKFLQKVKHLLEAIPENL